MTVRHNNTSRRNGNAERHSIDSIGLVAAAALALWNVWQGNYWEASFSLILLVTAVILSRRFDSTMSSRRWTIWALNGLLVAVTVASIWQARRH
jgi:hypothetical protein